MEHIEAFLQSLNRFEWLGILIARLSVGLLFILSGSSKLFSKVGRAKMLDVLKNGGVPIPEFNALFVPAIELTSGVLLFTGAATRVACMLLMGVMLVAISTSAIKGIKATSAIDWMSEFLYLPEVLYFVILLWIFFSGPGWLSVDHLLLHPLIREH